MWYFHSSFILIIIICVCFFLLPVTKKNNMTSSGFIHVVDPQFEFSILEISDQYNQSPFAISLVSNMTSSFFYQIHPTIYPIEVSSDYSRVNWVHISAPRREYEIANQLYDAGIVQAVKWVSIDSFHNTNPHPENIITAVNYLEKSFGFECVEEISGFTFAQKIFGTTDYVLCANFALY